MDLKLHKNANQFTVTEGTFLKCINNSSSLNTRNQGCDCTVFGYLNFISKDFHDFFFFLFLFELKRYI